MTRKYGGGMTWACSTRTRCGWRTREAGAGLALEELDRGGLVLPVGAQHLDGAGRVVGVVAGGVDAGHGPAAERCQQLVAGDGRQRLHGSGLDGNRQNGASERENGRCGYYRPGAAAGRCRKSECRGGRTTPRFLQRGGLELFGDRFIPASSGGGRTPVRQAGPRATAAGIGTGGRNRPADRVTVTVLHRGTAKLSHPTKRPGPRIRKLNSPWALERASLGKNSSTKM